MSKNECEVHNVQVGKRNWVLTALWWWTDRSWWIHEKVWAALLEPVVRDFLTNGEDDHFADDELFVEGVMEILKDGPIKALDEKVVEEIELAVEAHKTNAGLHPVEGE